MTSSEPKVDDSENSPDDPAVDPDSNDPDDSGQVTAPFEKKTEPKESSEETKPDEDSEPAEDLESEGQPESNGAQESEKAPKSEDGSESEAGSESEDGSKSEKKSAKEDAGPLIKKRTLFLFFFGLLIAYPLLTLFDVWYAATQAGNPSGDAAVVLGAAQYNGEPSPVFTGRLDRSAELFEAGSVPLIVVTGGSQEGDLSTEANAGYAYLRREAGLADEDLLLEVDGASTYESLAATARFLETKGVESVVLVTDPFHARRAALVAEEVGLNVEVAVTDQPLTGDRLFKETAAVGVGRIISFRRLERFTQ